jgi:hypothetical protein
MMDDDLNVGNLLETRTERAPTTERSEARLPRPMRNQRQFTPVVGVAIAAAVAALAIVMFSQVSGRRVHIMERY